MIKFFRDVKAGECFSFHVESDRIFYAECDAMLHPHGDHKEYYLYSRAELISFFVIAAGHHPVFLREKISTKAVRRWPRDTPEGKLLKHLYECVARAEEGVTAWAVFLIKEPKKIAFADQLHECIAQGMIADILIDELTSPEKEGTFDTVRALAAEQIAKHIKETEPSTSPYFNLFYRERACAWQNLTHIFNAAASPFT